MCFHCLQLKADKHGNEGWFYTGWSLQVFDDYLQQLAEDTAAYVRTVCQTIVLTVPKAIIHCQVCFCFIDHNKCW